MPYGNVLRLSAESLQHLTSALDSPHRQTVPPHWLAFVISTTLKDAKADEGSTPLSLATAYTWVFPLLSCGVK